MGCWTPRKGDAYPSVGGSNLAIQVKGGFCFMERKYIERFWSKISRGTDNACWIWMGRRNANGYGKFDIGEVTRYAHRISYELAYGEIPRDLMICHHCDNPPCVNPTHLFCGTNSDNMKDAFRKGRGHIYSLWRKGEQHPRAKLTQELVGRIRREYEWWKVTQKELAKRYGISQSQIRRIIHWKQWK